MVVLSRQPLLGLSNGFFDETSVKGWRRADTGSAPVRMNIPVVSTMCLTPVRRRNVGPEPFLREVVPGWTGAPVPLRSGLLNGTGNRPSAFLYYPNGGLCPGSTVMQVVAKYPNGRCGKRATP